MVIVLSYMVCFTHYAVHHMDTRMDTYALHALVCGTGYDNPKCLVISNYCFNTRWLSLYWMQVVNSDTAG